MRQNDDDGRRRRRRRRRRGWAVGLICAVWLGLGSARGAEATAFQVANDGNRYVGEQAKDKWVQMYSDPSEGGLTPTVWYVVYHDPTAAMKAAKVKFVSGKMVDVSRPPRLFEKARGEDRILDTRRLKVDSDKAMKAAAAATELKELTLKTARMWLSLGVGGPEWKVEFWAAKRKDPSKSTSVGDVFVDAETGKVLRTDVNVRKVD